MTYELHKHAKSHHRNNKDDKFELLHRKKSIRLIDKLVMCIGIMSPLTSIPQIIEIIENKNAAGVSILTWILYIILALFWVVYGIAHKDKIIIVNNIVWIFFELIIVFLALIY